MAKIEVLKFENVQKSFGANKVLNDLSFTVQSGELLILLGPNGAGKSTTISIATGLALPTSGSANIMGHPAASLSAKRQLGFVPQETAFPNYITPVELLRFMAAHYSSPLSPFKIADDLNFAKLLKSPLRNLSGGQRRLISIAAAFIGQSQFVILDEPTVGLDLEIRRNIWAYLKDFTAHGGTVLMTTHYLVEAEEMASRVLVLDQGKVVQEGHPLEIKKRFGYKRISFSAHQRPPPNLNAILSNHGSKWQIESKNSDQDLKSLIDWGQATDIEVTPLSLEEILGDSCH